MNYKYTPRFTPCGRSIKSLKGEASKLKKSQDTLSQRDALDAVAKRYNYSDWNEIINSKDPLRDQFFASLYQSKTVETLMQSYSEYLKQNNESDCSESFRKFTVEHYAAYKKLGFNNMVREKTNIDNDVLLQELIDHIQKKGIEGCLPQNLPSYLLNALLDKYEIVFNDESNDESDSSISSNILIVISILSYQRQSSEISLSIEELYEYLDFYYFAVMLESVNRKTEISFNKPSIKNIFQPDRLVNITLNTTF